MLLSSDGVIEHCVPLAKQSALTRVFNYTLSHRPAIPRPPHKGIGLEAAKTLASSGEWHVIMAVRSFAKAELAAKSAGMDPSAYTVMDLDLASLTSVRMFAKAVKAAKVKPDALVCNAAVWYPKVRWMICAPSVGSNALKSRVSGVCRRVWKKERAEVSAISPSTL